MLKSAFKVVVTIFSLYTAQVVFANNDLVGKWKNIDDKTGFSKAIIEISKSDSGIYTGKIIEVTPRPGYTPQERCTKCLGENKNKPIIGLQILNDIKRSPNKTNEFGSGTILDPLNGNKYKTTLRLNSTGNRLSLRGFVGVEALGRSQTWIRSDD